MALSSGDDSPNTLRESGFRANLHGASLADLVQMECLSGRERVIRVSCGVEVGYLYFRGGQIAHAVSRRAIGEAAALEILRWSDGTFEACNAGWPERESISSNWQNLLLLAAQHKDEQHRDESARHNLVAFPGPRASQSGPPRPVAAAGRPSAAAASNSQSARAAAAVAPPVPASLGSSETEVSVSQQQVPPALLNARVAVRVDPNGNVLSAKGDASELAEIAAYAARLAELVGEGLGMSGLVSVEVTHQRSRTLILKEPAGNVFALTAALDADLSQVRERLGL